MLQGLLPILALCLAAFGQVPQECAGKCKAWAECRLVNDTAECFCDDRAGPQCESGVDPCFDHRCSADAECVAVNDRPLCNCTSAWTGRLCRVPNPCGAGVCEPHGRCEVVTGLRLNRTCVCEPGWTGRLCKEATSAGLNIPGTIIVILSASLVAMLAILVAFRLRHVLRQRAKYSPPNNVEVFRLTDRNPESQGERETQSLRQAGSQCSWDDAARVARHCTSVPVVVTERRRVQSYI